MATRWLGAFGAEIIKIEWPENERGRLPSTTTPRDVEVNLNTSGNFNDTNVNETELDNQLAAMKVQSMADGGMGSIRFFNGRERSPLGYGGEIAEAAFQDADGVPVSISLSVDTTGDLFEMDVFKADFSPLLRYLDMDDLAIIERDAEGNVISAA